MSIKVAGTSVTPASVRFPFIWRNHQNCVFIRREDAFDTCLTTGAVSRAVTSCSEAWSMRLSQVTLISD